MSDAFTLDPVQRREDVRHPRLRLLYDAWAAAIVPGRDLPDIDRLLPAAQAVVGDDLWCLDIAVCGGRMDFIGRHFGRSTIANYGMDPTGRPISDFARQPVFARVMRVLGSVASSGQPQRFTAEQSVMSDGRLLEVEALALPVAGMDGGLSGVLGATTARPG
ncbi:hypothetical protein CHU95_04370 [Niveispirillum lacus]|uniref:PAS domain-containing protein n=1 Tax=Niveispirillum lacus TaxID=1981099 RepID=A0A255Z6D3_9PROT|nr:hypothetical protein [Niveispirillum lacus]OYQ36465.1 hypothetical protein CHU95_04370 [Niveispirillum lacus]